MTRLQIDLIPAILWMVLIFIMSSDLGSFDSSAGLLQALIDVLDIQISDEALRRVHLIFRKGGHLVEYAVLVLLFLHSARIHLSTMYLKWSWKAAGLSLVSASAYAATDEFHQVFVPSRTASLMDVLIDVCGAMIGLAVAYLWKWYLKRRIDCSA